jgi:Ca2+-binding RTX toxin-like protein
MTAMAVALMLGSGVALAVNTINCEGSGIKCVGTNRPDLMKGTSGLDAIYGRDKGGTLKVFGRGDASDSGPVPEVTNSENTNTVNWSGNVISIVAGSTGDDVVTGNDDANDIFDGEGRETDTGNISGAGGNDLLDVQDGAGDDTVSCGEGTDTVYFDEGDVLVVPSDCEEQNPI